MSKWKIDHLEKNNLELKKKKLVGSSRIAQGDQLGAF